MKPRNTLVTVAEIQDRNRTTDTGIVIPSQTGNEYKQCEVIAVGPGMITEPNEMNPARDLKPGQLVLVKLKHQRRLDPNHVSLEPIGVGFQSDDGRNLALVEQSQVVGIIAEPGDWDQAAGDSDVAGTIIHAGTKPVA